MSISGWHDACCDAFRALLHASSTESRYSQQLPHDSLIDLVGRFNVWAGNIGAGQRGRASLDYRLREAGYIQEAVIQSLRYLHESIQDAISIISGIRLPNDEASSDSESSDSSTSDIEHDATNIHLASAPALEHGLSGTELQQLHQSMSSFIKNLYQVSIIIRQNPASHDRIIKAAKIDTSFYEEYDIRHTGEKFPRATEFLSKRLGTANSRRRKYFVYREQHREKLSVSQDCGTKIPTGIMDPPVPKSGPEWQSANSHQGRPSDEDIPSAQQPTVAKESTTASTFVPKSVRPVFDPETDDQHSDTATQTTVATVSSVIQDHLNIPNPPGIYEDATEFECPYCYTIFSYRYQDPGKRRNEWKQHVLRDLQPYVCTFDGCPQANTLYERRSDWMHHEKIHHRREWSCNASGHEVYKTRNDLKDHMEYQHKGSFGMDQLDQIVDMLERPAASARFSCPLRCDDRHIDLDVNQLERHLGRHLQVIAAFTLPRIHSASLASGDSVAAQDARVSDEENSQSDDSTRDYSQPTNNYVYDVDKAFEKVSVNDGQAFLEAEADSFRASAMIGEEDEELRVPALADPGEDWKFVRLAQSPSQEGPGFGDRGMDSLIGPTRQELVLTPLLKRILEDTCPGTGSWLLTTQEFQQFKARDATVLLVEGLPGCGKTWLCARVIQALQPKDHSQGLAYYFFEAAVDNLDDFFASLVSQLRFQAAQIPPKAEQMMQASTATSASGQNLLAYAIGFFDHTILVIDALDKVGKFSAQKISRFIRELSNRGAAIQLFATSRMSFIVDDAFWDPTFGAGSEESSRWMNNVKQLYVERGVVDDDIQRYLRWRFRPYPGSPFRSTIYEKAVTDLIRRADGVFLIAVHMGPQFLGKAAETGLQGIENLWTEILARVLDQTGVKQLKAVRQILETLTISERPMNFDEIHDNLHCDSTNFFKKLDVWREIPALYELAGEPSGASKLALSHGSLKNLLQSDKFRTSSLRSLAVNTDHAQRNTTRRCVDHLLEWKQPSLYRSIFGWTAYAGAYWHRHAKKMAPRGVFSDETAIWRDCTRLLRSNTASFLHWTYMTRRDAGVDTDEHGDFGKKDTYPSPLYYAALLGLLPCAEQLIYQGENIDIRGGKHEYPILAAVEMGETEMVRLLLEKGADLNLRCANGDTVMSRCAELGERIQRSFQRVSSSAMIGGRNT